MDEDDFDDEELEEQAELEEQEELEEELAAEEAAQKQAEERRIKNQLKAILLKVKLTSKSVITNLRDKQIIQQAKKMGKFKAEILAINTQLAMNTQKKASIIMSSSPVIFYVALGALIIFLVIAVAAIVLSAFSFLFNDSPGESLMGAAGGDFYGVRVAYEDENLAKTKIIEDYVELVTESAEAINSTTTANSGGVQYSLQLSVNMSVPEGYDYSTFSDSSFATSYPVVYGAAFELAKATYALDNSGATYGGSSLLECASGVKYFGYNIENTATPALQYLLTNTTIVANKGDEQVSDALTISNISNQVANDVKSKLKVSLAEQDKRVEKLFVKDILLNGEEMVSGITKQNYKVYMFMPKKQVTFTSLSFSVGSESLQNFSINATYAGATYEIAASGDNLVEENEAYIYSSKKGFNVTVSAFTDINVGQSLETAHSLFDILQSANLNSEFFVQETAAGLPLTLKTSGLAINMQNTSPFVMAEFETVWK